MDVTQGRATVALEELADLQLSNVVGKATAHQHLLDGMTKQVQTLTQRVEGCEDTVASSGLLLMSGEDDSPSEFFALQKRVATLEAELAASRGRDAEHREMRSGLVASVEAMRVRLEGLEARLSDELAASARREADVRASASNAQAHAASAASAARAAALDAQSPLRAAEAMTPPPGGGRRQSLTTDEEANRAAVEAETLARLSARDAEAAAAAAESLRSELATMRREQAIRSRDVEQLHAELAAIRASAPVSTASLAGTSLTPSDLSRLNDLEASQRATANAQRAGDAAMHAWSSSHSEVIEALLSQNLTGRWVGIVGGGSDGMSRDTFVVGRGATGGAGVLVTWQHQAANTHADCFRWAAHTHAITCTEAGVYEVALGLWPPTPGLRAELQVDGRPAAIAAGGDAVGAGASAAGLPQTATRSEACGLCCVTLLSLHAGAVLALAAEHAVGPTKAYLGVKKL